MSRPAVSIVVPTHRGAARLPDLLDALAAQAPGTPAAEVIVVVDGDVDGSAALLAAEQRLDLRVLVLPENRGRVAALNAGLSAARGEVLVRCDDDLLPGPTYVLDHLRAHADGPGGAIGLYRNHLPDTPYARVYGRDADRRFRRDAEAAAPNRHWRFWAGNCSIPREVWEEVGPYAEQYRLYGWEDVDYGYRIHAAGFPVRLVPELATVHRVAAVTTASRARRARHSGAARRIFEARHPAAGLPPAVPPPSPWNLAVRGLSRVPWSPEATGRAVDLLLPRVPVAVGRKLVALVVESAALAGYRSRRFRGELF